MRFQRAPSCWYPTRSLWVSSRRSLSPQAFDVKKAGMQCLKNTSQQNLKKEKTDDTNENTYHLCKEYGGDTHESDGVSHLWFTRCSETGRSSKAGPAGR